VSLASRVNGLADRLLERSTWGRYRLGVRVLAALVCWLLGVASAGLTLELLKANATVGTVLAVTIGLWFGVLLAANVTGSRPLMRASLWSIPIIALVALGLAVASSR